MISFVGLRLTSPTFVLFSFRNVSLAEQSAFNAISEKRKVGALSLATRTQFITCCCRYCRCHKSHGLCHKHNHLHIG